MKEKEEIDNDWALDSNGQQLHISKAESGKRGYYCPGCSSEMVAKKGDIMPHHYAHYAYDVKNKLKCTFSSETYRHKIAKEILQRIGKIKVPAVKVFDKTPDSSKFNILIESKFIYAKDVKIELEFYEDENCNIKYGRGISFSEVNTRTLLIRPDVTFFDKNNNPILFIELVSTHAVDFNKLAKLKNLGINTVQVKIPKTSAEEIEKIFLKTINTQWLYNYESEYSEYQPRTDQSIFEINQFEREVFDRGHSFKCRVSEINNFIRKIKKIMDSDGFIAERRRIESEIQRIEENTKRERKELEERRREIELHILNAAAREDRCIGRQEGEFESEEEKFDDEACKLERRYTSKREEIEGRIRKLAEEEDNFKPECFGEIRAVENFLTKHGAQPATMAELEEKIRFDRSRKELEYSEKIERIEQAIIRNTTNKEGILTEIRDIEEEIRGIERNIGEEFRIKEERIGEEYEKIRKATIDAIERKDPFGVPRIADELSWSLSGRDVLSIQSDIARKRRKIADGRRAIENESYKNWT